MNQNQGQNVQYNEMNDILNRTNKKLGARLGTMTIDLDLANSQVEMLQELLRNEKQLTAALQQELITLREVHPETHVEKVKRAQAAEVVEAEIVE
jgi:hypothetical protein